MMNKLNGSLRNISIKSAAFMLALLMCLNIGVLNVFADDYYDSWNSYADAAGLTSYTWNEVVDAIESVMGNVVSTYEGGDADGALDMISVAKNSYWGKSGLKIEMQKSLPSASKKTVESDFAECNSIIRDSGSSDDLQTAADVLVADLRVSANKLDGVEEEVDIIEETDTAATELFAEQYYSTWAEYTAAAGLSETVEKWNDVADAMSEVFKAAKEKYAEGDAEGAYNCVNDGYYGYYETTGFERNAMGYISGARKSEVELQFSACKSVTKNGGSTDEFDKEVDILRTMIRTDANKLDGVSDDGTETSTRSAGVATFIACFTIILREGFEAILVVGAIIAYLTKMTTEEAEKKRQLRMVYIGAIVGILLSFVSAWALNLLKLANSASQEVIEGVTALIAVVVLYWVSNWMVSKSESEAWDAYIKSQLKKGSEKGSAFALAFTAFLAVYREGAEVILFYQPLLAGSNINMVWLGFIIGCICLVFVYLAIRFMSLRIPLKPFFLGTSVLMFIMSISFLGAGIKELIEGDVITMTSSPAVSWIPSNSVLEVLGIYPCDQTVFPQLILLVITIVVFIWQLKKNKKLREEAAKAGYGE